MFLIHMVVWQALVFLLSKIPHPVEFKITTCELLIISTSSFTFENVSRIFEMYLNMSYVTKIIRFLFTYNLLHRFSNSIYS